MEAESPHDANFVVVDPHDDNFVVTDGTRDSPCKHNASQKHARGLDKPSSSEATLGDKAKWIDQMNSPKIILWQQPDKTQQNSMHVLWGVWVDRYRQVSNIRRTVVGN